jgi:hypothetical protein
MAVPTPEEELELLDLADADAAATLKSPRNASLWDKTKEVGRSFGWGVKQLGEFGADVLYDPLEAATPKPGSTTGETLRDFGNSIKPWGEPDPGDIAREEFYDKPIVQSLTEPIYMRGENTGLDMAKTAAEWAPSLVSPSSLPRTIGQITLGGGGAAAGEQLFGEIGEVFGGIIGAIKGGNAKPVMDNIVSWLKDRKGLAKEKAEQVVAEYMRKNATSVNPEAAVAEGVARGEQGTTAQLAGDTGLFGVEAGANVTPGAVAAQRTARQGRADQIVDEVGGAFGPELPQATRGIPQAAERAEQQIAGQVAESQGRLSQAVAGEADALRIAEAQRGQVAPSSATFEASEGLASTLDKAQAAYEKAFQNPAWKEFDALRGKSGAIESGPFKTRVDNFIKRLSPTERTAFQQSYGSELAFIEGLNATARPSEIAFLLSRFKTVTGNAASTGSTTATEKFLTQIGTRMEDLLRAGPAGTLYDDAIAATVEGTRQFNMGGLRQARLGEDIAGLGEQVVKAGDAGATSAGNLANSPPEVIAQTGEYLKALAQKEGLNAKFIDKYNGFLSRFPDQELVTELRSAAAAETRLTQATAAARDATTADAAAQQGIHRTVLADFATKPIDTMAELLGKRDSITRLNTLIDDIADPAALRDAFRETFVNRMSTRVGGQNRVTPKAQEEFDRVYPALERLFADAPDELRAIQNAVEKSTVDLLRESVPGTKLVDSMDELDNLLSSAAAATIMTTGNLSGTHALMVGGAIKRFMMRAIGRKDHLDPEKIKILSDMVSNPEEFLRIMGNAPKQAENVSVMERVTGILDKMIQPGFAGFMAATN